MNATMMKGNWKVIQGKLRKKYAELTNDDLIYNEGSEDEIIGRIQKRTGESRERIKYFIDHDCGCA